MRKGNTYLERLPCQVKKKERKKKGRRKEGSTLQSESKSQAEQAAKLENETIVLRVSMKEEFKVVKKGRENKKNIKDEVREG